MISFSLLGKTPVSRSHDVTVIHPDELDMPAEFVGSDIQYISYQSKPEYDFEKLITERPVDMVFSKSTSALLNLYTA